MDAPDAAREAAFFAACDAGEQAAPDLLDWRDVRVSAFLALDRADALEAALTRWFGDGETPETRRFGLLLAYVRAERLDLDGALATLGRVAAVDDIGHDGWRTLADWAAARGDTAKADAARVAAWGCVDEWVLRQALYADLQRVTPQGDQPPAGLDPLAVTRTVALFRKAEYPAQHLHLLHALYAQTKDYRLLTGLPEAVIGHTPQAIYAFLVSLAQVGDLVFDEASVDRCVAHLATLHAAAKTDTDRRALRCLEFAIERRATGQAHGTATHTARATRALHEAMRGAWAEGERAQYAGFLAAQGTPLQPATLAEARRAQLRELRAGEPVGAHDRLVIAGHLAEVEAGEGDRAGAVRTLEAALGEVRGAAGGRLPPAAAQWLSALAGHLQALGNFPAAEQVWLAELAATPEPDHAWWLRTSWLECNHPALAAGGRTSLGEAAWLSNGLRARILLDAAGLAPDENQVRYLVEMWCRVARTTHERRLAPGVGAELRAFAFQDLPRLLGRFQYRDGQNAVSTVAETLGHVASPIDAVEFLVVRAETEPRWLRLLHQDFWACHGHTLARWRAGAGAALPAGLVPRVVALATRELTLDLETGQQRDRTMFEVHHSWFWAEQSPTWRATALAVVAAHPDDAGVLRRAAEYLYHGLTQPGDAIAVLQAAHARGVLDVDSRLLLATFCQWQRRWKESLDLLPGLVEARPLDAEIRAMVMRGWHGCGRPDQVAAAHDAALAALETGNAWHEAAVATLARACRETGRPACAAAHYAEAIAIHVREAPNRGVGDGVLASYYGERATVFAELQRTLDAVDAAAGAIVAWGPDVHGRGSALAALEQVLGGDADLSAVGARCDAEAAASGVENPLLRRALGKAWLARGRAADALPHLRLSAEATPEDAEATALLVQALDASGRAGEATGIALVAAHVRPRDPAAWAVLAQRYAAAEDSPSAERARTTMVEMLPNESEGHAALAALREQAGRLADAAHHWRQVIRVRSLEPTGYLECARVWLAAKRPDEARPLIQAVLAKDWPSHFGDVRARATQLLADAGR